MEMKEDPVWNDNEDDVEKCIIFDWQLAEINLPQDDLALMLWFCATYNGKEDLDSLLAHYWFELTRQLKMMLRVHEVSNEHVLIEPFI